jgi:hypothetical protein
MSLRIAATRRARERTHGHRFVLTAPGGRARTGTSARRTNEPRRLWLSADALVELDDRGGLAQRSGTAAHAQRQDLAIKRRWRMGG